jgi:hypothetical protein
MKYLLEITMFRLKQRGTSRSLVFLSFFFFGFMVLDYEVH